jgi:S1-C subfamily serine protease
MRGEKISHPYLGVQMITLTPDLAQQNNDDPNSPLQVPEINGVLVVRVLPNSPAAAAGMRRADVIVEIDGQTVKTAEQLQGIVDKSRVGQVLQVKVQRGDRTQQFGVRAGELENASK